MRVAHVNQDPGIGPARKKGAAVHLSALRSALTEVGATVFAMDESDPELLALQLAERADTVGLDFVYERYALGAFAASDFAHKRGLPHVLEVNAPLEEEARRFRPESYSAPDAQRERALFENAARVLAVSQPVADYAVDRGAQAERVVVVANGVDVRRFHPGARDEELLRARVPAGRLVIGFHGRLRPWHNLDLLVSAIAGLEREGLPCQLWTIGEGPFEEHIAGRLPPQLWCHDPWIAHEHIAARVACFDVLALCYRGEADFYFSPLKLAEGMAAGAVPVVPDVGALPDEVRHGETGLVYPAESEQALCEALRRLAEQPELRDELSRQAQMHAKSRAWTRIASDLVDCMARS